EIQVYWEAAIAQLKGVSPESPMYALAQDKLSQYEKNLTLVQARLAEETRGQELLRKARAIASEFPNPSDEADALTFCNAAKSSFRTRSIPCARCLAPPRPTRKPWR
ncbi:MAG: hypothetical protein HC857_16065, partial [Synechococcales cyanobacterium RU_4_20]|nr:hypothetical protein [Synechococcales cyanobacterium RU_4_20]